MSIDNSEAGARRPGMDGTHENGLFKYNREDMSFDEMQARRSAGKFRIGDMFAVFRDDFGALRVQHAHFEDYVDIAYTELFRSRRGFEDVPVDPDTLKRLVGLLMISRIHGYQTEDFIQMLDFEGVSMFDFRGICQWVSRNEGLFISYAEAAVLSEADDRNALEKQYDNMEELV